MAGDDLGRGFGAIKAGTIKKVTTHPSAPSLLGREGDDVPPLVVCQREGAGGEFSDRRRDRVLLQGRSTWTKRVMAMGKKEMMGKNEIVIASVLIILSVTVYAFTYQFPPQTVALAPTAFPRFVSACLFILAVILLFQGIAAGVKKHAASQQPKVPFEKVFWVRFVLVFLAAFAYISLLPLLGYIIATLLFVMGIMLLFNERRGLWLILVPIATSLSLYLLFRRVFHIPLPRWNF